MKKVIFTLSIILLAIMWTSTREYGRIPNRERMALKRLFNKTGGEEWKIKKGWKDGEPGTECTWPGIRCDENKSTVLGITLKRSNLKGEIPADLGALQNLETLELSNNQLEKVHEYVGKLSKLTTLDLSNNQLSGNIPAWIENLTNLKKLDLSNNRFTGDIPSWIGKLRDLEELLLDGNRLSGPIPGELGNLPKLTVLRIGHNRLSGEIPSTILKLTRLTDDRSNFKWNGLFTNNKSLRTFLKKKQYGRDWESTQTTAPRGITAFSLSKNSIELRWQPIAYTANSGGYRVFYSTAAGGPYKDGPIIDDKAENNGIVKNLVPSTRYYFKVQTWTDNHGSNRDSVYSELSKVAFATTRGITISGSVTTSKGEGVAGVQIIASNKGGSDMTDSKGEYHLAVTSGWSGTATPSKKGYNFKPTRRAEYSNVTEDIPNQDYTADPIAAISGTVTELGKGVPGVKITFESKDETAATETNSQGFYSHALKKYKWTGTVTPSKTGYKFELDHVKKVDIIGEEKQDFKTIPPGISGKVTDSKGKGIKQVTLTFSKDKKKIFNTKTKENGEYSQAVFTNWTGEVRPSNPPNKKYIFYPAKRQYENVRIKDKDPGKIEENYKAELDLKCFISVTGNYRIPPERGLKDIYGSGLFTPELKVGYKFYRAFYIWGGFGFSTKSDKSHGFPGEPSPAKWKQAFLSLGLGYNGNMSIKFGYKAEVGMFYVSFRDEMENIVEEGITYSEPGTTVGVRIGGAAIFKISDRLFTEVSLGYLYASDKMNDTSIRLGGIKTGVGFGLRF